LRASPTHEKSARKEPRLHVRLQPPRPGYGHPAGPQDLLRLLDLIGAEARYGLRAVEFRQASGSVDTVYGGRLCVPGRILLYEQPVSPWLLSGRPAPRLVAGLLRAGAQLQHCPLTDSTRVDWPQGALRRFMLLEVFLHELGHHVFQHHKGKRLLRVARTHDHEAFACAYAAHWRPAGLAALEP
jgi:hypothetical protein